MGRHSRLALDAGLLIAFLVALRPELTGVSLHEWLSVAIGLPTLLHLVVNWDWVLHAVSRVLGRMRATSRVNLGVDAALFVSAVTVMVSGFAISQVIAAAIGVSTTPGTIWYAAHALSARTTVLLLLAHLALNARWIIETVKSSLPETSGAIS